MFDWRKGRRWYVYIYTWGGTSTASAVLVGPISFFNFLEYYSEKWMKKSWNMPMLTSRSVTRGIQGRGQLAALDRRKQKPGIECGSHSTGFSFLFCPHGHRLTINIIPKTIYNSFKFTNKFFYVFFSNFLHTYIINVDLQISSYYYYTNIL